jgi:transposase
VLDDLVTRYQMFKERCQGVTLVFDKGNNSEENIGALDDSPYHVIGSLVPTQHQDLLDIPHGKFRGLKGPLFEGLRVFRTEKEVFGRKRVVVVTRSQALLRGQIRGIRQHLDKRLRALRDLQQRVARSQQPGWRGKPYTRPALEETLKSITSGQYIREFLWARVAESDGRLAVEFGKDDVACQRLKHRVLGKRILFTTNPDLTDAEIVFGYRGQHNVERAFREMKDPCFIRFSPAFHWTDATLRVHAFYCVLALTLMSLLHREAVHAGIEVSLRPLIDGLKRIKEITNYYPAQTGESSHLGGRPRAERTLTRLSVRQGELFRTLGLAHYQAS